MPERQTRAGQLDQISERIGELTAYIHEHRHGVNNLSQKMDGLALDVARQIEKSDIRTAGQIDKLETKLGIRLDSLEERIKVLEETGQQQTGAKNVIVWFLQSPLVGWIAAGIVFLIAFVKGREL